MNSAKSTSRLLQYSFAYFLLYTITGLSVKYFESPASLGFPGLTDLEFLVYSTVGSAFVCLAVILFAQWWRFAWRRDEIFYMAASGVCTAVVLPTTTLMYSLPISIMVAMVLMRGSIICISRLVDTILRWQGLLQRPVTKEENIAVALALASVGLNLFFAETKDFQFLRSGAAITILASYIFFYAIRIYIMNYFKNTRSEKTLSTNKNFFAIEQLSASLIIATVVLAVYLSPRWVTHAPFSLEIFYGVLVDPPPVWKWVAFFGMFAGASAFFSVFLFLFEGRNSTFSGLVNRVSSLLAGTCATLLFALFFHGSYPRKMEWLGLVLIIAAVYFLVRAEIKRRDRV